MKAASAATAGTRIGVRFRDDINGMRAVAVLGVVAYHFQLARIDGGFVGVDVFFVISGFLMTQIIAGRLDTGRFTFGEFYGARVRRIVPALVVLVAVVTLAGYLLLDPLKLDVLAQDAAASLLFVSNVLYAGQGGYFAVAADQNWLLHTWSLSVEWQFYLLFPILLWALHRQGARLRTTIVVLAVIGALSFAKTVASSYAGGGGLINAFYMIHARAWEFVVGALCAYALPRLRWTERAQQAAHVVGLATVVASMGVLQSRTAVWPSAWAALPVGGTALVLVADREAAVWARCAPVAALGRWSYSIYLWHWPLAAMSSFFGLWSLGVRASLALASIGLGALSYGLVERRATEALWRVPRRALTVGLPAYGATLALAAVALATNGLESLRFAFRPDVLAALRDYRAAKDDWMSPEDCGSYMRVSNVFTECRFGKPAAHDTLVIGDSFAEQLVPRYRDALTDTDVGLTFVLRGGCIPMPGVERIPFGSNCDEWVKDAYAYARREDFKRVVVVSFWFSYDRSKLCLLAVPDCGAGLGDKAFAAALDDGYRRMAEQWRALKAQGKAVVVVEEPPFGAGDPSELYERALNGKPVSTLRVPLKDFEQARAAATARLAAATAAAGASLVDPAVALCPDGLCPFVENGRALYKDGYHLRASLMKRPRFSVFDRYILPGAAPPPSIN